MSSLLLLNGSPRGPRSNSMKMLSRLAEGWERAGGAAPRTLHLAKCADFDQADKAFAEADCVILGMPLYTDAMPGLVMTLIERLSGRVGRADNPRLGFLVQSGFYEALHSRPLERYLEKLAARLEAPYAGTIVRGNGEALQAMPDEANEKLWEQLRVLGEQLERDGRFDSEALARFSTKDRLSPVTAAAVGLALRVPATQFYWNRQLKRNGAWERRFATPYRDHRE